MALAPAGTMRMSQCEWQGHKPDEAHRLEEVNRLGFKLGRVQLGVQRGGSNPRVGGKAVYALALHTRTDLHSAPAAHQKT